jgi:hypothetical protein
VAGGEGIPQFGSNPRCADVFDAERLRRNYTLAAILNYTDVKLKNPESRASTSRSDMIFGFDHIPFGQ